jgi:hypothetical protein
MTPDIVTNAIVSALSAGATSGVSDVAKSAIATAYENLKWLIKKKFGSDSEAAEAIEKLEVKPDSDGRRRTLGEELSAVSSSSDAELLVAAQSLLSLIAALPRNEKHTQAAHGTGIAQADRGSSATVSVSVHPRKDD